MARMHHWLGLAALSVSLTGCVAPEKYNALKLDRDRLAEQLGAAQADSAAARSEAEAYKNQLGMVGQGAGSKDAMILNLSSTNADLQKQLEDLNRRYADAINRVGTSSPLPPALTNELSAFAAQNPDLVDFDAGRGIVKFKSDVTFKSGSSDLTPQAKDAIGRFSQILNSAAASGYELMIAGHTDNTRVANPATIQAGHKDNWYLSAHRAISVGQEMQNHRVNQQRLAVTGYADQRPIANNASETGKAQNRRVEVLILPTTVRGGGGAPVASGAASRTQQAQPRPNKDFTPSVPTANTDRRDAYNK